MGIVCLSHSCSHHSSLFVFLYLSILSTQYNEYTVCVTKSLSNMHTMRVTNHWCLKIFLGSYFCCECHLFEALASYWSVLIRCVWLRLMWWLTFSLVYGSFIKQRVATTGKPKTLQSSLLHHLQARNRLLR